MPDASNRTQARASPHGDRVKLVVADVPGKVTNLLSPTDARNLRDQLDMALADVEVEVADE